jgi:hypothetical protein
MEHTSLILSSRPAVGFVLLSRSHTARPAPQPQGPGRPGPQAAAGAAGGLMPAGFSSGFDWSAPAFKAVPRADAAGGLPDVELYGLRVPGVGLVGVAAAGAMFGLKGLLAAAVLGEYHEACHRRHALRVLESSTESPTTLRTLLCCQVITIHVQQCWPIKAAVTQGDCMLDAMVDVQQC